MAYECIISLSDSDSGAAQGPFIFKKLVFHQ